jgi:hypothetical protein
MYGQILILECERQSGEEIERYIVLNPKRFTQFLQLVLDGRPPLSYCDFTQNEFTSLWGDTPNFESYQKKIFEIFCEIHILHRIDLQTFLLPSLLPHATPATYSEVKTKSTLLQRLYSIPNHFNLRIVGHLFTFALKFGQLQMVWANAILVSHGEIVLYFYVDINRNSIFISVSGESCTDALTIFRKTQNHIDFILSLYHLGYEKSVSLEDTHTKWLLNEDDMRLRYNVRLPRAPDGELHSNRINCVTSTGEYVWFGCVNGAIGCVNVQNIGAVPIMKYPNSHESSQLLHCIEYDHAQNFIWCTRDNGLIEVCMFVFVCFVFVFFVFCVLCFVFCVLCFVFCVLCFVFVFVFVFPYNLI